MIVATCDVWQFEYLDWLADEVGAPPVEEQIRNIYKELIVIFFNSEGDEFREWDVDGWINSNR